MIEGSASHCWHLANQEERSVKFVMLHDQKCLNLDVVYMDF